MTKIYIYKLTSDDGGAPCLRDGILSLAICKPAIRSVAEQRSIVLGFAGNDLYKDNCLIYAARITKHLDGSKYFSERSYSARPDCIYQWDGRRFEWKTGAAFHSPSALVHDLGKAPGYNRAKVLLSEGRENFRYFGSRCSIRYKKQYPHLGSLIERLGQGHRVNFGPDVQTELRRFIQQLWDVLSPYQETTVPDGPCEDKCGAGDDDFATGEC